MSVPDNNANNINFGPCNVSYNSAWLGLTQGEVTCEFESVFYDVTTDQYGPDMPVAVFHTGDMITVTVNMLETSITRLQSSGVFVTGDATTLTDRISFGKQAGQRVTGYRLVCDPTQDNDLPLVVYSAIPVGKSSWNYGLDNARVMTITFRGLPDLARADGDQLFRIGGGAS